VSFRSSVLFVVLSVIATFLALELLLGCHGPAPKLADERALARGAVEVTAAAVAAADKACAELGTQTRDVPLLRRCEHLYNAARGFLVPAAQAVDAWDRVSSVRSVRCGLVQAVAELEQLAQELGAHGVRVPPIVADARALVTAIGGCPDV
jgi:hypothetical protein